MPFTGFGPNALPFLKALAFHQSKEWFEANRATYEADLRAPMGDLVEDLAASFAEAKIPLKGDRKASLFRIHRDVRFANDKSPYKTNVGAVMTRAGAKSEPGLFYMHVAPGNCLTAAGFYDPAPATLAKLRNAMLRAPKAWKNVLAKLEKGGLAPSREYALKRPPRGFEGVEDEAIAAALRLKSIVVTRPLEETRIASAALVGDLVGFAREALPLLAWGWEAISDARAS
ncbi:MAG TPA: TIGR02453 family protein [Roseiarcus sp.]|nr:TIGR02453 family protein [Roseiarcus sp.]